MVNQRISLKDCAISINGSIIGGAEEVTAKLSRANTIAHEAGSYIPAEIVDGAITIDGTVKGAWLDVDLINTLFPNQALSPSFTISGSIVSGKTPQRRMTILGAKFKTASITGWALTEYAKNEFEFDALNWKFEKA